MYSVADLTAILAGRYAVERPLGAGGMAEVFAARDLQHDRMVAIKVVRREVASPALDARFKREVRIAAQLQHPHVVPLYDSGASGGLHWYVMPMIEGPTLREQLATQRSLGVEHAVRVTEDVAGALEHAHARGIVHRDIKPENIFLTGGRALVSDFGIARLDPEAGGGTLTDVGFALGTPAYMSPEQAAGERAVDGRTDQYALACVVYEMLTGRPPFVGETAQAVIVKHFLEPVPRLAVESVSSRALDAVLGRALAKEPAARFATVGEFARALRAATTTADVNHGAASSFGSATPGILPAVATPLVGRDDALTKSLELLGRPDVRLVTFTGPGGAGKTRLAVAVCERLVQQFEAGVWFVSLGAVAEASAIPDAVAESLGLAGVGQDSFAAELAARLGDRAALVVLDDFERHVAAASWVGELLARARTLKVLVTSRIRLRLRVEHELPVSPLEVPNLTAPTPGRDLASYASVQLFAQRALAADPSFTLSDDDCVAVAEICARLDGLPLAIELAAARVRLLPPRALLGRLKSRLGLLTGGARDLPARHRALRDTIAWSYDLLGDLERRIFARLAAFAGGCTIDAAEAICGSDGTPGLEVLDGITVLLDASLLTRSVDVPGSEPRLGMLETIREFALERLADDPNAEVIRGAHSRWYLDLARRAAPELSGPEQDTWLAALAAEHANLGLALDHAVRRGDTRAALAFGAALWRYCVVRGHVREGREWLDRALALPGTEGLDQLRADVLDGAANLAHNAGDLGAARKYGVAAVEVRRRLTDHAGVARGLATLGWVAWLRGEYPEARRLSDECLTIAESLGDRRAAAQALSNLGWVTLFEGDLAAARALFEQCLAIRRELADRRNIAFMLIALGWTASRAGDSRRAFALLEEALPIFRAVGDDLLYAFALSILAETALTTGDSRRAQSVLESEALPLFRRRADRWGIGYALTLLSWVERERGDLSRAEQLAREGLEVRRAFQDRYGEAQSLAALGAIARARGDESTARALYTESQEIRLAIGDQPGTKECARELAHDRE